LLIREAKAADEADLDDEALEVDCDMAQAFEIPGETGQRPTAAPRSADIAELPATLSRSPLPVRPSDWIGIEKYGPGIGLLQASGRCPSTTRDPPESGSAIDPRLIISGGFDKGSRQESIEGTESPSARALIRFFMAEFVTMGSR
jgi:hypothetical protein